MSRFGTEWSLGAKNVSTLQIFPFLCTTLYKTDGYQIGVPSFTKQVYSVQLVIYDAVNRNKVSIRQLSFIFFVTHYMFRPLWAIFR
jgi:hypothetical protein